MKNKTNNNSLLLYRAAQQLHLPFVFLPRLDCYQVKLGSRYFYFLATSTPFNRGGSIKLTDNKNTTNIILNQYGISVPKWLSFTQEDWEQEGEQKLIHLRFPLVAKPMKDTGRGRDILCNIKTNDQLKEHLGFLFQNYQAVQIEEFYSGFREYRILVLYNKVIGVVERFGASIVGDGVHTIEELIAINNIRRKELEKTLTISPLSYDEEYKNCLEEQGLTLESIPLKGQRIRLAYTANTGRGGDVISRGKKIDPENAKVMRKVMEAMGLNYGGIDLLCEDINKPFRPGHWVIIEVNRNPDLTIHEASPEGIRVQVSKKILKQLILRHPFSYLFHLTTKSRLSPYFKSGGLIVILQLLIRRFGGGI